MLIEEHKATHNLMSHTLTHLNLSQWLLPTTKKDVKTSNEAEFKALLMSFQNTLHIKSYKWSEDDLSWMASLGFQVCGHINTTRPVPSSASMLHILLTFASIQREWNYIHSNNPQRSYILPRLLKIPTIIKIWEQICICIPEWPRWRRMVANWKEQYSSALSIFRFSSRREQISRRTLLFHGIIFGCLICMPWQYQ